MSFQNELTTSEIGAIFTEEVAGAGGSVVNAIDDGNRLFMRAILRAEIEVKSNDRLQGGVAIRATEGEIWVHPYVFRQVCQNGAIIAHAAESRHLESADYSFDPDEAMVAALREAVQASCAQEAFSTAANEMRSAVHSEVDFALTLMPMLSRLPAEFAPKMLNTILDRFVKGRDNSRFGLLNAVTSVARDTSDPEMRWQLEAIGGDLPSALNERKRACVREMQFQRA